MRAFRRWVARLNEHLERTVHVKRAAYLLVLLGVPWTAALAQGASVVGTVVDDRRLPIPGATVRLTGNLARTTGESGQYEFHGVAPGSYALTVTAIGHEVRVVDLTISSDTTIRVVLPRKTVILDTVFSRPENVRIKGIAVDARSGNYLMQAQATLYPQGRFIGALNGNFVFDSVPPGLVTIVVEGFEHLPVWLQFQAVRDTSLRVPMGVDSVAVRMIAVQVARIQRLAQAVPLAIRALNRDAIANQKAMTMGELLRRQLFISASPRQRPAQMAACMYLDAIPVDDGAVEALDPDMIELVEIFGPPRMPKIIAVYTKRYVASLIGRSTLDPVRYQQTGLAPVC